MGLNDVLQHLRRSPTFMRGVTAWKTLPAREGRYAEFPTALDYRLRDALRARGIERLYTHQAASIAATARGENVVVVTPTASGKTLCYNLPVLHTLLHEANARALYLFPTKALAQDQFHELETFAKALGVGIRAATYDGDTPAGLRRTIRSQAQIVITNPDMLHTGILPHHTKWAALFTAVRGRGRGAHLPGSVRQPRGQRPPPPEAHLRFLRLTPAVHLLLGDNRQPSGIGRTVGRGAVHIG